MTESKLLDRDEVASKLSELFDREVSDEDLYVVRETAEGDTIAVTSFGNKVRFPADGGDPEVLQGPMRQALEPITPPAVETPDEEPEDLPPLEGTPAAEDAEDVEAAEDEEVDYEEWTVEDLKAELSGRDLPVSGNKAELIERLVTDDEGNTEPE